MLLASGTQGVGGDKGRTCTGHGIAAIVEPCGRCGVRRLHARNEQVLVELDCQRTTQFPSERFEDIEVRQLRVVERNLVVGHQDLVDRDGSLVEIHVLPQKFHAWRVFLRGGIVTDDREFPRLAGIHNH